MSRVRAAYEAWCRSLLKTSLWGQSHFETVAFSAGYFAGRDRYAKAVAVMIDRNLQYDGPNIVIPCASHAEAIRTVANLRAAHEGVE